MLLSLGLAVVNSWIKINTFKMNTFYRNNCIAMKFATKVEKKSYACVIKGGKITMKSCSDLATTSI